MKKTTRTIRALAVSAALMATLWPTSGTAHLLRRTDPEDTSSKLDIVKTSFDHGNGKFILSFTTASRWSKADIYECGVVANQGFTLDTSEDRTPDYYVSIFVDEETGAFTSRLYHHEDKGYIDSFGTITKRRKSLTIKIPKGPLQIDDKAPRWRAWSSVRDDPCATDSPITRDYAPDAGLFKHRV